jgi:acetolactate synthase-1/2/3 large subunit
MLDSTNASGSSELVVVDRFLTSLIGMTATGQQNSDRPTCCRASLRRNPWASCLPKIAYRIMEQIPNHRTLLGAGQRSRWLLTHQSILERKLMKVHAATAQALTDLGVDTIFGLIGDTNMYLVDSYVRLGNRYVAATNENAALMMAAGYASVTGRVGVATITQMAVTVTVPALIEGVRGRRPLVLIAGDTPLADKNGLQNIDQTTLIRATGAGYEPVRSSQTVVEDVRTAMRRAISERRPIVLSSSLDLQWEDMEYVPPIATPLPHRMGPARREALEVAVGVIASANRPIILAGAGACTPEGKAAVARLAERVGAPVATTLQAKCLMRDDAFNLGIFGTLSSEVGLDAITQSDCVLAFGASLNSKTTDGGELLKGKRLVHCDVDPTVFGRDERVDAELWGDVVATVDALIELLDAADVPGTRFRSDDLAARIASQPNFEQGGRTTKQGTIHLRDALEAVNEMVPANRTLTVDAGRFMIETLKGMPVEGPRQYVHTTHIGAIGLGVAASIGAAVADETRPSLVVVGDGGFMFGGVSEFQTAVRNRADLIVAVMNDGAYGAEHVAFRQRGLDPTVTRNDWPEFEQVARAMGGEAVTVRGVDDLQLAGKLIANRTRPVLIDFRLDPDSIPDPGFRRH